MPKQPNGGTTVEPRRSIMRIDKVKDFIERVGWTAIQAGAGAAIVALTSSDLSWQDGAKMVGAAAAIAGLKVFSAQQFGTRGSGDAIPGGVEADHDPVNPATLNG